MRWRPIVVWPRKRGETMVTEKCPPPLWAPAWPACRRLSSAIWGLVGASAARSRRSISAARSISGQHLAEWFYAHARVDPGRHIRIGLGPGAGVFLRLELGHDQAAAEAGRARIGTGDGGEGPGEHQPAFVLQLPQAHDVGGAGGATVFQASFRVGSLNDVEHQLAARSVADLGLSSASARMWRVM